MYDKSEWKKSGIGVHKGCGNSGSGRKADENKESEHQNMLNRAIVSKAHLFDHKKMKRPDLGKVIYVCIQIKPLCFLYYSSANIALVTTFLNALNPLIKRERNWTVHIQEHEIGNIYGNGTQICV